MKLKKVFFCLVISILITNSGSLKVIFARNTTAQALKIAETERVINERESSPDMSTIINVQANCKPGFVYESTFHNRCRRIAG